MDLSSRRNFSISFKSSFLKNLSLCVCNCLIITILLFHNELQAQSKSAVIIDVAKAIGSEKKDFLSNYAKDIQYIPLETRKEALIKNIRGVVVEKDKIYINSDAKSILIFDIKGKFLGKVDKCGRGPQEYISISSFRVDPQTGNIVIVTEMSIFEYDINGNLINKLENTQDKTNFISFFKVNNDALLINWTNDNPSKFQDGLIKNAFSVLFKDGTYKNLWTSYASASSISKGVGMAKTIVFQTDPYFFYKCGDLIRGVRSYSDTIIGIDSKFNIRPEYIFTYGKYGYNKYDYSDVFNIESDAKIITKYNPVYETSNFMFIMFQFRGLDPEPYEIEFKAPYGAVTKIKHTEVNAIFNKKSKELILLKRPEKEKIGLIDNIKNGPPFWPKSINSKNDLISYISASDLIKYILKEAGDVSKIKNISSNLSEEDNPVVIIAVPK